MKLLKTLFCCASIGMISVAQAQSMQELDVCQNLVLEAETEYDVTTYDDCGFNDLRTAIAYWAPLAEQNKWGNALYEIYKRHADYPNIKHYLYMAAKFGQSNSLVLVGHELFDQGKVAEAMRYYNVAIHGDLDEETQGVITGRLAMLYVNPNSPYYDINKSLPLLQKAALQRQAQPNNVLGVLSLFGMGGLPQNAEESFKYFWRAILLGCPAAEENLGFFLLAKDKKINNDTLKSELLARAYSCDAVAQTSTEYPPYHLTFNPQQCADLNYYAQRLVDTSLPFTGKEECAFSADMSQMADYLSQ